MDYEGNLLQAIEVETFELEEDEVERPEFAS